jgi:hypothetical protein
MATLTRELRRELERCVKQARRVAETGGHKVIERLGVGEARSPAGLTSGEQSLRLRLRAHGRQLGDRRDQRRETQTINHLVAECAYEHWHRMLFARFLAENGLLIEPEHGVAITLAECQELAREQGQDWLALASSYAVGMLPQIFRPGDPVLEVGLPPETRSELEDVLKGLSSEVFLAEDSLGWVYQFWQADRKDEVNASEVKIGADELPAVTQLFTEDYIVLFLLHNTLGAWWAGKVLAANPELAANAASEDELRAACAVGDINWTYLRFVRDPLPSPSGRGTEGEGEDFDSDKQGPWRPAAGTFDGWPKTAKEITVLDPCMGSGHFLVFALPILVALRMAEEDLSHHEAVYAVLRENLFGLEIDPRCTQIAAFNLALAAWRMVGYRTLPPLQLACSGLSLGVSKDEWLKLAELISPIPPEKDLFDVRHNLFSQQVQGGLEQLYDLFEKAPWLGSLIDPRRTGASLIEAGFTELESLLKPLLASRDTDEISEMAVTAQGLSKAAELLSRRFTLVVTNVPYLGIRKQGSVLLSFCEEHYNEARHDIATVFVDRCFASTCAKGTVALVTTQNWRLIGSYKIFRERLLRTKIWKLVSALGVGAFETISGEVVNVGLFFFANELPSSDQYFSAIDVCHEDSPAQKASGLISIPPTLLSQAAQFKNPDSRVILETVVKSQRLSDFASSLAGIQNGDSPCYLRCFWEMPENGFRWAFIQTPVNETKVFGGMETLIDFDVSEGHLRAPSDWRREALHDSDQRGKPFWGRRGVIVNRMGKLPACLYMGDLYDQAGTVIVPKHPSDLPAVWAFCSSGEYNLAVRKLDRKVNVTSATLVKVAFNLEYWRQIATENHLDDLPSTNSNDPAQWIFNGHMQGAEQPLQVAVARLLGYQWPRQIGSEFPDCPALGPDGLESHADNDGIVCLTPVKGEASAANRLNSLLAAAFGAEWSAGKLDSLLADVDYVSKSLEVWLRDGFFANHCEVFHNRPFIWHIWDGRQDGFHAMVNYHRLAAPDGEGRRTLEKLIYSYLGDWIDRQRRDQQSGIEGSDARLAAAEHLKAELEKILAGETPYDIFVRWKPLNQQPIGWDPDINDGVRINIRPFMTARPLGARSANACILRSTPRINWGKDRGKEPKRSKEDYPWFWGWNEEDEETIDFSGNSKFDGNRWNGLHYSNAYKQAARQRKEVSQ